MTLESKVKLKYNQKLIYVMARNANFSCILPRLLIFAWYIDNNEGFGPPIWP